jgi:predicted nicotinamide N-methyase
VALKVWEAGACLAEYLIQNPHYMKGKKGFELGAGVGLTGLVAMACCEPLSIHMTDYTEAGLNNLQHNININSEWIQKRVGSHVRLKEILTLVSAFDSIAIPQMLAGTLTD